MKLKHDHELIESGPYRYIRHPIYAGLLVAFLGTALKVGDWRGLLAVAIDLHLLLVQAQAGGALADHFARSVRRPGADLALLPVSLRAAWILDPRNQRDAGSGAPAARSDFQLRVR